MISKIGVENSINNKVHSTTPNSKGNQIPSFKGGVWALALQGIQGCERNPMLNVAVIDMLSAILPRTAVESLTNWFAGFEAFRRESSGLFVNCIIPGFITLGMASILNKFIMQKGSNMSKCWADNSLIERATEIYTQSNSDDKIKDSFKKIIEGIEGFDGKTRVRYGNCDALTKAEIESYAQRLKELSTSSKDVSKNVKELTEEIVKKTHVFENITLQGGKTPVNASNVKTLLEDSVKYFREYQKVSNNVSIVDFAKQSKKLVKAKSFAGLAIILPLAASMQYINRWITEKVSGVKGAPIYDDFGKEGAIKDEKAKEGLLKQKIISISSMIGVSLLSMMKKPSWNMLEFKGPFPTMDQARIISTTTFASRMAVADDKNELAEATWRDIATFCGLYFFGDYAAKATATMIEKKYGITLLNETKELEKDANIFKKIWHWVKDINIKSSEEVVSKTAQELKEKGITPDKEQLAKIDKELKRAINLRSACQVANLGVSLILLGIIVPIFTRNHTKKKHAEAMKAARENSSSNTDVSASAKLTSTQLNYENSTATKVA